MDGGKSPFFSSWQGEMDHVERICGEERVVQTCSEDMPCLFGELGGGVVGCGGRRIVVGHYRKD